MMTEKEDTMEDILMTPFAVSLDIGKSVGAVRCYALSGKLPFVATTTGRRLFRKSDVDAFKAELAAQRHEPPRAA